MIMNEVGIAGEVRCVVSSADGVIKTDTGYQKNLILNQGLDFFGGDKGVAINQSCAIGSGNSTPVATQTKLDAFVAIANGTNTTSDYSYVDDGSGLYKMWEQKQYRFTGLNNVNISEIGLVSNGGASDYYLTTRVLLKDALGAPTTITVKSGETLDIYYKVHKVISTSDKSYVINVLDGDGGAVPYNVVIRPAEVGTLNWGIVSNTALATGNFWIATGDIVAITGAPSGGSLDNSYTYAKYDSGSYKIQRNISVGLGQANKNIRSIFGYAQQERFFAFQMRLGRVSDDAPLTKTNKDTLTIPLEFSWGRYEGEL